MHIICALLFTDIFWPPLEARECRAAQGPYSEVVPRAFWRFVSKSFDECKVSFERDYEAKRWSHWACSSLGTIFQPMRINSVPDVKCFCNNKNVLRVQSMVWYFVRHPVGEFWYMINHILFSLRLLVFYVIVNTQRVLEVALPWTQVQWRCI